MIENKTPFAVLVLPWAFEALFDDCSLNSTCQLAPIWKVEKLLPCTIHFVQEWPWHTRTSP